MMHWWYGGFGVGGYLLMAAAMVAFWALVIFLAIALLGSLSRNRRHSTAPTLHGTPEEILAERFARGDISEQEYHERLSVLHGRPGSANPG